MTGARSTAGVAGRLPSRPKSPGERLGTAVAAAVLLHGALLLFLELAVQAPWPRPHTYLGSLTVELEALYFNDTVTSDNNCDRTGPVIGTGPYHVASG